jgi:succinate dehydrogenase / fumarate reductase flavoprotein subunit
MQGLGDGYFVIPYTLGNYFASTKLDKVDTDHAAFKEAEAQINDFTKKLLNIKGKRTVDSLHRELGKVVWDKCGMARNAEGLKEALKKIPEIREEFWQNVNVAGSNEEFNQSLEKAGRVADFMELAELMCIDALDREESCGCHFRLEYITPEGEAQRNDDKYCYVAAWEYNGANEKPTLHKEQLSFENVSLTQRSYK